MIDPTQLENCRLKLATGRKGIGGPKTPEGKVKVSLNALKHGLDATSEQAMQVLVRRIARASWRMMYTEAAENRSISRHPERPRMTGNYERIIRNERFIDIHLHRAVFALEHKRRRDYENSRNKLNLAPIHEGIQP